MGGRLMHLFRDSENSFTITIVDSTNTAVDVSDYEIRFEFSQDGTTVSLTDGDGIGFQDDGSDGIIEVTVSKSRTNQFCTGFGRLRCFNDAGTDPILFAEGSFTVEGQSYDA
jgi:hypothetical protein